MNAFSIIFLIEPFMYYKILTAQTGHALHVLKTLLYVVMARARPSRARGRSTMQLLRVIALSVAL